MSLRGAQNGLMEATTRDSWHCEALPTLRADLGYTRAFDRLEAERAKLGLIPEAMEDKWFILFDDGWLLFYRSWTGFCIFGLELVATREGFRVGASWVSRDPEQYGGDSVDEERQLVADLIDRLVSDEGESR